MIMKAGILAVSATLIAVPASGHQAQPDTDQVEEVSNATRIVCRRLPPPTGFRVGLRNICKTQSDWERIRDESRMEVQRQQDASHF